MLAWIQKNPVLFSVVVWPLVTMIFTAVFKRRTAEDYAAMPPRLAAILRLVGALGFDAPKALESARLVLTGKRPDGAPATPRNTGVPPLPLLLIAILLVPVVVGPFLACTPGASSPARDSARATTLLIAQAQKTADGICAQVAKDTSNAALAKGCADAYDTGRASLLSAEGIVDAWDSADRGSYLCTLAHAVDALANVANAVKAAGGPTMPAVVVDALTLGSSFAKGCAS